MKNFGQFQNLYSFQYIKIGAGAASEFFPRVSTNDALPPLCNKLHEKLLSFTLPIGTLLQQQL
jgi:hypothetical protein